MIVDQIFSVYMLTCVEKYDPSVTKREMSNKKIYLYDNGFAAVTQYSFFEDRGKLLENLVFAHLRAQTEEIFFLIFAKIEQEVRFVNSFLRN